MVLDTAKRITRNRQRRGFSVNDYELIFKNTYDEKNIRGNYSQKSNLVTSILVTVGSLNSKRINSKLLS